MHRLAVLTALAALALATATLASASPYSSLNPGGPADLDETVPVNVVFLGYEPADVPSAAVAAELPGGSAPVVRSRLWYGVTEPLGIDYAYDVDYTYTSSAYENAFFAYLTSIAVPQSTVDGRTRTLFQNQYNAQAKNVLDAVSYTHLTLPTNREV